MVSKMFAQDTHAGSWRHAKDDVQQPFFALSSATLCQQVICLDVCRWLRIQASERHRPPRNEHGCHTPVHSVEKRSGFMLSPFAYFVVLFFALVAYDSAFGLRFSLMAATSAL